MLFIQKLLEHSSTYESPNSFWQWSAFAAIATVLRDNCFLTEGHNKVYPNIYVMIYAGSSFDRKNNPISTCQTLVTRVGNSKVISGRASIQAVLDELNRTETDSKTGKIVKGGAACFFAKELSSGIIDDTAAINILTDIYDYDPNPYKHLLRSGPCFQIEKIVLSMLGGTNEEMGRDLLSSKAVKGGLLARTILVVPNEERKPNSLLDEDNILTVKSFLEVTNYLKEISTLTGEFVFEIEAKQEFKNWYEGGNGLGAGFAVTARKKYRGGSGVEGRLGTHVKKIAMLLAANELSLHIKQNHIEEAIAICLALLPNYQTFVMSSGKSTIQQAGSTLLTYLLNKRNFLEAKKMILRDNWSNIDLETFEKLVTQFETAGMMKSVIMENREIGYQLTDQCIQLMRGN